MATNTTKRKQQQRQAVLRIVIMAGILICLNILAARFHYGLDLTRENRFTLSDATKKLLRDMDEVVVVDVYLKGNFPAGFQKLAEATRERLQSFRDYAGNKVVFRYIDPFEGKAESEKVTIYQQFGERGMIPVNLQAEGGDAGYSERIIFPWALVQYKGREMPIRLLENNMGMNAFQNLNNSEAVLEYKFASAINKLNNPAKKQIAYIMGNGQTLGFSTYDVLTTLAQQYELDTLDLVNSLYIPSIYDAIIINRPDMEFDDRDKFKIDQYIMNGGNVLWAIDKLHTPMDSIVRAQQFIALEYPLNLDDQLFKYGVRINADLVEEFKQCLPMPVKEGEANGKPNIQLRPWIYYPVFSPVSEHPIAKNLDFIMGQFVNSIDTVANPEIRKTILLQSSQYSRTETVPVRVSMGMMYYPLDAKMFNNGNKAVAVLLEGKFKSVFQNRLHPSFLQILRDSIKREFKPEADTAGSMIVIADGDIMGNDFSSARGPMEMGYWQFSGQRFANKEFILNCVEYLTDHSGLIEARSKDMKLRLLDPGRVKAEKAKWRVVNIGIPIALVLVFASAYLFFRKRRYEVKHDIKKKS
jgi:ABC-2 type transport system permease protein